jgi:hypothetical protein
MDTESPTSWQGPERRTNNRLRQLLNDITETIGSLANIVHAQSEQIGQLRHDVDRLRRDEK